MALRYKAEPDVDRNMIKLTDTKTGKQAMYDDEGNFVLGTLIGVDIKDEKILDQLYWMTEV